MKSCVLKLLTIFAGFFSFPLSATNFDQTINRENSEKNDQEAKRPYDTAKQYENDGEKPGSQGNSDAQGKKTDQPKQDKKDEDKKDHSNKKQEPEPSKLLKIGNLAFPTSQQPVPLVSFGQNIVEENQVIAQFYVDDIQGKNQYFIDVAPAIIYGFLSNLSIFINAPYAARFRNDKNHSSGPQDIQVQLEAALYTQEHYTSYDQITIVGNVTIPSGSSKKRPPTGAGSNSFFLGMTFSTVGINWFYFSSYGGVFYATSHKTRFGNQFLYQAGVGKRIFSNDKWLLDWMIEMNGTYSDRNRIQGGIDLNSGGNVIVITPSLFLASKKSLVVQAGIGFPVVQQMFGHQKKNRYVLELKLSWAF